MACKYRLIGRNMATKRTKTKELDMMSELADLLRKNSDRILTGESKLSLTTQSLNILNSAFRQLADGYIRITTSSTVRFRKQVNDIEFLEDIFHKTVSLKIIQGSMTIPGPIQITSFVALTELDIKKMPIHFIEGLQSLRGHLQSIMCTRCLRSIQDLFETCGGDMSSPLSWPELKSAYLGYNNIQRLDTSLRLLPAVETMDLSHNSLDTTGNYLAYLTELLHLNVGFNQLSEIPVMSLSAKTRITTLVIKNNNLENINGINELVQLQELDVSNNCLSQHDVLHKLLPLNNLKLLYLHGNPLAYHDKHRVLTVKHISATAAQKKFILDGAELTASERAIAIKHKPVGVNISRRPSAIANNIISPSGLSPSRDMVSQKYSFTDSECIAHSVPSPRTDGSRSKKGKGKGKPKTRKAVIAEFETSTEISSTEGSLAASPSRPHNIITKMEHEALRDHYGPNWLARFNKPSHLQDTNRSVTEDDIYLNESQAGVLSTENEDDFEILNDQVSVDAIFTAYKDASESTAAEESHGIAAQKVDSVIGIEWQRSDDETAEYYGPESDPFLVTLAGDEEHVELFLTVNDRYIVEKDVNGDLVEMLDLRLLRSMELGEILDIETTETTEIMPMVKLTFDYIKKDRQERIYIMEDDYHSQMFDDLLKPKLEAKEIERKSQNEKEFQCLKCSNKFTMAQPTKGHKRKDSDYISMQSESETGEKGSSVTSPACPRCNSELVMELDSKQHGKTSNINTPVGSYSSASELKPRNTSTPVKTPGKQSDTSGSETENYDQPKDKMSWSRRSLHGAALPLPGRKDFISSSFPDNSRLPKIHSVPNFGLLGGGPDVPGQTADQKLQNFISSSFGFNAISQHSGSLRQNYSKPDTAGSPCADRKTYDTHTHDPSLSSIYSSSHRPLSEESDITVLSNPSGSSSISIIPESGSGSSNLYTDNNIRNKDDLYVSSDNAAQYSHITSNDTEANNITKHSNGETPIGSPLTSSVCSSMVSSVYQNSMQTNGHTGIVKDQNTDSAVGTTTCSYESKDSITVIGGSHNTDLADNNEYGNSIYDSGPDQRYKANSVNSLKPVSFVSKGLDSRDSREISIDSADTSATSPHLVNGIGPEDSSQLLTQPAPLTNVFSAEDFTKIDHRLKLYFLMSLFRDPEEECACMLQCGIVQYMMWDEYFGILLVSNLNIYIMKITGSESCDPPEKWLNCIEVQPMTELQYIDIGMGHQSFRLEFDTECSSYSFVVRDQERCQRFLSVLTGIVQSTVFNNYSKLEAISKFNPVTAVNLQEQVLKKGQWDEDLVAPLPSTVDNEDGEGSYPNMLLVKYLMGFLTKDFSIPLPISLVVTTYEIFLVNENHQWPLPRLQAPLDEESVGPQFKLKEKQSINNISHIELCLDDDTQISIIFFDESGCNERRWDVAMETEISIQTLLNVIKGPWKKEFGIDIDISWVKTSEL